MPLTRLNADQDYSNPRKACINLNSGSADFCNEVGRKQPNYFHILLHEVSSAA